MKRYSTLACVVIIVTVTVAAVAGCASLPMSHTTSPSESATITTLHNPWVTKNNAYRGALHAHTTESDGTLSPQQLVDAYAHQGFSFVFITDHDTITRSPAVPNVLALTGQEDETCLVCPPHTDTERAGHIVALNVTRLIPKEPPQAAINDITGQGGMAILAHPTLPVSTSKGFSNTTLQNLTGYLFIEITNVDHTTASRLYDVMLSRGVTVWLVGDDDAHQLDQINGTASVIVNADRLTPAAILASLEAGNFYVTSGHRLTPGEGEARISSIVTHNSTITVTVPTPSTVTWIQHGGAVVKTTGNVTSDTYTVRGDEQYVRIEVQGRTYTGHAWSQPIFVETRA